MPTRAPTVVGPHSSPQLTLPAVRGATPTPTTPGTSMSSGGGRSASALGSFGGGGTCRASWLCREHLSRRTNSRTCSPMSSHVRLLTRCPTHVHVFSSGPMSDRGQAVMERAWSGGTPGSGHGRRPSYDFSLDTPGRASPAPYSIRELGSVRPHPPPSSVYVPCECARVRVVGAVDRSCCPLSTRRHRGFNFMLSTLGTHIM